MLYQVTHETRYDYSEPAVISHNQCHLLPRSDGRQVLHDLKLRIDPSPAHVDWHRDYYGNDVVFFNLQEPHERLVVRTESRVEVTPRPELRAAESPAWEQVVQQVRAARDEAGLAAFEMVWASPFVVTGALFADYARGSFPPGRPLAEALLDLNARIHREFRYDPEATTLATPIGEVLEQRHGVCQDFAHLMIGCLRSLGLPARYVSGYLRSAATEGAENGGADELVGAEASHAWVSAWCPVGGWIDLDPTNDLVPSDRHVVLAQGRDYDDVSPVKGVTLGGGAHSVAVEVEMRPVDEPEAR
ncbi:MAG: transglutaminase family protein [Myxococcota bacterium]|nr:transglutaminase family protein [Myxococcota bacterium]